MTYNDAIIELNAGKKISRWNNSFLFHALPFAEIPIIKDGVEKYVNVSSHYNLPYRADGCICKKTETDIIVGWTASEEDLASTDWMVY